MTQRVTLLTLVAASDFLIHTNPSLLQKYAPLRHHIPTKQAKSNDRQIAWKNLSIKNIILGILKSHRKDNLLEFFSFPKKLYFMKTSIRRFPPRKIMMSSTSFNSFENEQHPEHSFHCNLQGHTGFYRRNTSYLGVNTPPFPLLIPPVIVQDFHNISNSHAKPFWRLWKSSLNALITTNPLIFQEILHFILPATTVWTRLRFLVTIAAAVAFLVR